MCVLRIYYNSVVIAAETTSSNPFTEIGWKKRIKKKSSINRRTSRHTAHTHTRARVHRIIASTTNELVGSVWRVACITRESERSKWLGEVGEQIKKKNQYIFFKLAPLPSITCVSTYHTYIHNNIFAPVIIVNTSARSVCIFYATTVHSYSEPKQLIVINFVSRRLFSSGCVFRHSFLEITTILIVYDDVQNISAFDEHWSYNLGKRAFRSFYPRKTIGSFSYEHISYTWRTYLICLSRDGL